MKNLVQPQQQEQEEEKEERSWQNWPLETRFWVQTSVKTWAVICCW